jgi:predicted nucleic acid-binding protein
MANLIIESTGPACAEPGGDRSRTAQERPATRFGTVEFARRRHPRSLAPDPQQPSCGRCGQRPTRAPRTLTRSMPPSLAGRLPCPDARPFFDGSIVTYLLDTSAISALMRADARMASWLSSIGADDRVAMLYHRPRRDPVRAWRGWLQGRRRTELEGKAGNLFAALPCEPIPPAAGDRYANVKVSQRRRGLPLDENDLWIAATALAIGRCAGQPRRRLPGNRRASQWLNPSHVIPFPELRPNACAGAMPLQ